MLVKDEFGDVIDIITFFIVFLQIDVVIHN